MATDTASVTSRSAYLRKDIQGLRAIAVLAVIAFHAGLPVPGGFIGVDIFFVISGFVITGMLWRERVSRGSIRLRTFYWRRIKRLTPALSIMLATCLALSIPLMSPFGGQQLAADTAIAATFSVANLFIARSLGDYFGPTAEGNLFLNTWSLSVEEQFYLILPALLAISWVVASKRLRMRHLPLIALAVISVASLSLAVLGSTGYSLDRFFWILGFFSPLTRVWEFGAGAILALLPITRWLRRTPRATMPLATGGLIMIAIALVLVSEATPWPGPWTLVPVVGTALLLAAGCMTDDNPVSRGLSFRPLVQVGDYSYSLYLWHWPFIVLAVAVWGRSFVVTVIAAMTSAVPAVISYYVIEQPLRRSRLQRPVKRALLVLIVFGAPVLLSLVIQRGAQEAWGLPLPERPLFGSGSYGLANCMRFARSPESSPLLDPKCQLGDSSDGRAIYLVGDSQAAQWTEAVETAARQLGASLTVSTAPGCPFLDLYKGSPAGIGADDWACRETFESTMAVLTRLPPGDVVIGQSLGYWIDEGIRLSKTSTLTSSDRSRELVLSDGLAAVVSALEGAGHRAVVVVPMLQLASIPGGPMPSSCSTLKLAEGICFQSTSLTELSSQVSMTQTVRDALRLGGVQAVDLLPLQCPKDHCGLWNVSTPIYSDSSHVSAEFSVLSSPYFELALLTTTQPRAQSARLRAAAEEPRANGPSGPP